MPKYENPESFPIKDFKSEASCIQFTYEVKSTGLEIVKKFYLVKDRIF